MDTSRPDTDADSLEPYRIRSAREILLYLEEIRRQRQLMRMVFSEGRESALTSILDIDADSRVMYIDAASDLAQNRRIVQAPRVAFDARLNRIPIQFVATGAQRCERDGYPALHFALPESLVRIQRRQSFRITVPFGDPIRCTFMPPGTEMRPLTAPTTADLLNISTGGVAVIDSGYMLDSRPGAVYTGCTLELPVQAVTVTLEVRHAQVTTLPNGKAARHIGCRFLETPTSVIALVQRYIMKLEREQNAKSMGG